MLHLEDNVDMYIYCFHFVTCLGYLGHLKVGHSTLTHCFLCSYSPTLASVYSYYSINPSKTEFLNKFI
jgi:hypothetical protein